MGERRQNSYIRQCCVWWRRWSALSSREELRARTGQNVGELQCCSEAFGGVERNRVSTCNGNFVNQSYSIIVDWWNPLHCISKVNISVNPTFLPLAS